MKFLASLACISALCLVSSAWAQHKPDPKPKPDAPKAGEPTPPSEPATPPAVEFPHPMITEVLYAVPTGDEGDADQSGKRSATGDEFVELINPHSKPINLKGYTLTDGLVKKGSSKSKGQPQIRFVFPDLTLKPGEVVVVFNGSEGNPAGPVGDTKAAAGKNDKFHQAYVLTMRVKSTFTAFSNEGDCVLLSDPAGKPIECVRWGEESQSPEKAAPRTYDAPESRGSVQREGDEFVPHRNLSGDLGDLPFSPGKYESTAGKR